MPNSAKVQFNVRNFTPGVSTPLTGIYYVEGITKRGPVENPEHIVNNWSQFERLFGGLMETSNFPLLAKRALARGAQLRICRVDAASTPAVKATAKTVSNTGALIDLFTCQPKYKGVDYNNISIEVTDAGNGSTDYWKLIVTHAVEDSLNETYDNIPKFNADVAANQTCLDEVKNMSQLLDFTYLDATGAVTYLPVQASSAFVAGVDPTGHVPADYSGTMSAFDDYDDGMIMAVPEIDDDAVNSAGGTYAAARGDLVFFAHLGNSLTTAVNLITERETVASNTKHIGYFGGGIKVRDERTLEPISISEMGDVLGIAAYVHGTYWPWYSLAGQKKGSVPDATGVVNNFGTPGGFSDLNLLANAQINTMVKRNGVVQLAGNFSGQLVNNQEKYMNVVFLSIWMKRTIKPILEEYLEEPNDTILFKRIYHHIKPLLDKLESPDYRAIFKYEYYGDQDANSLDELQINDKTDVQNGKYKINLKIWAIASLQELTFNLMLVQGDGVFIE